MKRKIPRDPATIPFPLRWCSREDSNLHGFPHTVLSRARLPVPPREHSAFPCRGAAYFAETATLCKRNFATEGCALSAREHTTEGFFRRYPTDSLSEQKPSVEKLGYSPSWASLGRDCGSRISDCGLRIEKITLRAEVTPSLSFNRAADPWETRLQ
jgi:hypothetical protein